MTKLLKHIFNNLSSRASARGLLTLCYLFVMCGSAWGNTVQFIASEGDIKSKTINGVTFSFDNNLGYDAYDGGVWGIGGHEARYWIENGNTVSFSFSHNLVGYDVVITGVSFNGCTTSKTSNINVKTDLKSDIEEQFGNNTTSYGDYSLSPVYLGAGCSVVFFRMSNSASQYARFQSFTISFELVLANKAPNHVPFSYRRLHFEDNNFGGGDAASFTSKSDNATVTLYDGGVNYLITGSEKLAENSLILHFEGIPDKLSFQYKPKRKTGAAIATEQYEDSYFSVYQKSVGGEWVFLWDDTYNDNSSYKEAEIDDSKELQLESTTRLLKFVYRGNADYGGYFGRIKVTELQQFAAETSVVDFGPTNVSENPTKLLAFMHANAGETVTVMSSSDLFTVTPSPLHNTGADKLGVEACEITFQPNKASVGQIGTECVATITFSDGTHPNCVVTVKGVPTNLQVPKFTWNPEDMSYYCSPSDLDTTYYIPNIFSSSFTHPEATITFSSSDEAIAKVEDNRLKIFTKDDEIPQEVTITVTQEAVAGVSVIVSKEYTFTPHKKVDLNVPFMVTENIFSNAYEVYSKLNYYKWDSESGVKLGGDEAGAWPWFDFPSTMYDAKYVVFEFEGVPDSLFFQYRTNNKAASESGWIVSAPNWYVYVSANGKFEEAPIWHSKRSESSTYADAAIALPQSTRYIKLVYQGNFAGYFKDIKVTAFDGYYYVKTKDDNKYLSRGGIGRDKAVVDFFGIAIRKTRNSNKDNLEETVRFQQIDNMMFFGEDNDGNLITNTAEKRYFIEEGTASDFILYSANGLIEPKKYVKVDGGLLSLTEDASEAVHWVLETPLAHKDAMQELRDSQVETATSEFGERVSSLANLRARLRDQDYDRDTIKAFLYQPSEAQQETNNNQEITSQTISGLTPGLYCLNVKAFYRTGPNTRAYDSYLKGFDSPVAYVGMKDESIGGLTAVSQIVSIYDAPGDIQDNSGSDFKVIREVDGELKEFYYPRDLTSAKLLLDKNLFYDNDVYLYVRGNEISYSIQSPSNSNDSNWLCYKNITLTRLYRKGFVFDNNKGNGDGNWTTATNWYYSNVDDRGIVPEAIHKVTIDAPVTITNSDVGAYQITYGPNGKITIGADASLSVREGGIEGASVSKLVLLADDKDGKTGALRLYPGTEAPEATVLFHSKAEWNYPEHAKWQYIGSPVTLGTIDSNEHIFYRAWLYQWTNSGDWVNAGNWGRMVPFRGYAFTRDNKSGPDYSYSGRLNAPVDSVLHLTNYSEAGENVFANSWTAPIDLTKFEDGEDGDFINVEKSIYLFKMGNESASKGEIQNWGSETGQYAGIPIFTAPYLKDAPKTLSAMQGFVVRPTEEGKTEGATLKLNYERLVWKNEESAVNEPLRAPGRGTTDLLSRVCVHLTSADSLADRVYLLEKEARGFARGYDDGYDAKKMLADGLPAIYTYETFGKLAVAATDTILGTYLGINTTAATTYTIAFSDIVGEGLALRDLLTDTQIAISEGSQYTFTAVPNTQNQLRFVVEEYVEPTNSGNGGTDLGATEETNLRIWQENDLLTIINAPRNSCVRLYDADGRLLFAQPFHEATTVSLTSLPAGVYVASVGEKNVKILR